MQAQSKFKKLVVEQREHHLRYGVGAVEAP